MSLTGAREGVGGIAIDSRSMLERMILSMKLGQLSQLIRTTSQPVNRWLCFCYHPCEDLVTVYALTTGTQVSDCTCTCWQKTFLLVADYVRTGKHLKKCSFSKSLLQGILLLWKGMERLSPPNTTAWKWYTYCLQNTDISKMLLQTGDIMEKTSPVGKLSIQLQCGRSWPARPGDSTIWLHRKDDEVD